MSFWLPRLSTIDCGDDFAKRLRSLADHLLESNMSFHPHTPQSPSQLSPSTTDPSTSMTSSISSLATTLPTPAHSVTGSSLPYPEMAHETNLSDDTPQKRKRPVEDAGDREQKKVHIEDRRLGIENLHLDVGEKYLLCRTRKTPFNLHHSSTPPQAVVMRFCIA